MNTLKTAVILFLVLFIGIFAGSLGTRVYVKKKIDASQAGRMKDPGEKAARIARTLAGELKLDDRQQQDIEGIIAGTEARAARIKSSCQPELEKVYRENFARIMEKLRDDQKAQFRLRQEQFLAHFRALYFRSLRYSEKTIDNPAALKDRLGLTDAQMPEVTAILKELKERQGSIIAKYEKMTEPDLAAVNAEIEKAADGARRKLAGVLTPDQLARYGTGR